MPPSFTCIQAGNHQARDNHPGVLAVHSKSLPGHSSIGSSLISSNHPGVSLLSTASLCQDTPPSAHRSSPATILGFPCCPQQVLARTLLHRLIAHLQQPSWGPCCPQQVLARTLLHRLIAHLQQPSWDFLAVHSKSLPGHSSIGSSLISSNHPGVSLLFTASPCQDTPPSAHRSSPATILGFPCCPQQVLARTLLHRLIAHLQQPSWGFLAVHSKSLPGHSSIGSSLISSNHPGVSLLSTASPCQDTPPSAHRSSPATILGFPCCPQQVLARTLLHRLIAHLQQPSWGFLAVHSKSLPGHSSIGSSLISSNHPGVSLLSTASPCQDTPPSAHRSSPATILGFPCCPQQVLARTLLHRLIAHLQQPSWGFLAVHSKSLPGHSSIG
ncbi:hypothetical protein ACOMHN_023094 [Nucella lapillus]